MDLPKLPRIISEHKLATILFVGIIVRIVLMPISDHPFDVWVWFNISKNILKNGPFVLQSFPPLWYHYMMVPIAYSYSWLSGVFSSGAIPMASLPSALNFYPSYNIQYVPGMLFNSVVKIPFLISDISIAFLLYKIVEEVTNNKGLAEKAAFLWFLNPFVIWISAGWGMWDTISALFSLAALFFLVKKKIPLSAVCLSLGVASKLYPALFLVPIGIYLLRLSPVGAKGKNCMKFFSFFTVTSVLLFLPYLGTITSSLTGFLTPNFVASGAVADPIVNPLGFGLSYWSLYLLNRLFNLPLTSGFASVVSVASIFLVATALGIVYWKISKRSFQEPAYDLALFFLLPILALFLSYRFVCEQWFVWTLPFLIILWAGGRLKRILYWSASFVALLYAVLNCPFPFFFLPLSPWYTNNLLSMVYATWAVEPIRIILLALLGVIFSILLIFIIFNYYPKMNFKKDKLNSNANKS